MSGFTSNLLPRVHYCMPSRAKACSTIPQASVPITCARAPAERAASLRCHAADDGRVSKGNSAVEDRPEAGVGEREASGGFSLGDVLGPIGLTFSGLLDSKAGAREETKDVGGSSPDRPSTPSSALRGEAAAQAFEASTSASTSANEVPAGSIHSMSTEEWQRKYEADGFVDLWLEEEFNAGSRVVGGRDAHKGQTAGFGSGEGPSAGTAPVHRVRIINHHAGQEVEVDVPEDRYILWEAEEQGLLLPYACRMGCCTACAVKVLEGEMYQPQSLGVSAELRARGYALMCVGYPLSDLVLETVAEDEVYDLQFGEAFASQALNPSDPNYVELDPFALEIANMDE